MFTRRGLSIVLIASIIVSIAVSGGGLSGAGAAPANAPAQPWTLEGRVFQGQVGDEGTPLQGVSVSLYGSNDPYPATGQLITSATTDGSGWYGLTVSTTYERYIIRETDPPGYASVGATSVDGLVRNSNWIEYAFPLDGQVLTGNKFWDNPAEPYFGDNFDDGQADGWVLSQGWSVVAEGGGYVLRGSGDAWAEPLREGWVNYECFTEVRLTAGAVQLGFRVFHERANDADWVLKRYYLRLQENYLYLRKQIGTEIFDLHEEAIPFSLGTWHEVRIRVEGTTIQVYIDGAMVTSYTDMVFFVDWDKPLLYGTIAFESLAGTTVDIDNLNIIGVPLIPVLPGYWWYRTGGPLGGLGYDVRIHPTNEQIMFVTDNPSGVNKSTDGGATWTQKNVNIDARTGTSSDEIPIFALTIDPNDPNIVWAGTQNVKGIYRSTDGGEDWHKRDTGVTEGNEISFRNFGIHPNNSNIVFAGAEIGTNTQGQEFGQTKGKIYKTTDGGQNWYSVWQGTDQANNLVRFVLFNYSNPQVMYASTGIFDREAWSDQTNPRAGVGMLKSTDGGENWFPINNGITVANGNRFLGFLDMHPSNPQILMAAAGNNVWGNGGVYRTTDGGQNWSKVKADDIFTMVVFSPSDPQVVYAGSASAIYRSDNGGDTWLKFQKPGENNWGPPGVRAGVPIGAVVDPDDPMTIFVNNYQGGNFKSTDGGQNWVDASSGYTGAKLSDIAVEPNNPSAVYTIGRSGPFRSTNAGTSWMGLAYTPAAYPEWNAVAINPSNPNVVLISDELGGIILKSTDRGQSWRIVYDHPIAGTDCNPPLPRVQWCHDGFRDIAYAPNNASIVYAGMRASRRNINHDFPARPSYGMFKSTDGGENWSAINNGLPTALINIHAVAVHPTNANVAYIGTWKDGLYKTTDGGQNWVAKSNGLVSSDVRSLAIDPSNAQVIYAGLGEGAGIYKSTNGGDQWTAINNGLKLVCPSYLLPVGGTVAGLSPERPPDLPRVGLYAALPWTSIWALAIDPSDTQTVYAADNHSGAYLSTNGGGSWAPINDGLNMRAVTALAISSNGQFVYAATWGGGVFRLGAVQAQAAIFLPLIVKQ